MLHTPHNAGCLTATTNTDGSSNDRKLVETKYCHYVIHAGLRRQRYTLSIEKGGRLQTFRFRAAFSTLQRVDKHRHETADS